MLQPVANVVSPAAYMGGYTAVTTKFDTGREQFTTFYPCAGFSSDCLLTAHMYFAWGMHGILPGSRDSLFSVQVRCLALPPFWSLLFCSVAGAQIAPCNAVPAASTRRNTVSACSSECL